MQLSGLDTETDDDPTPVFFYGDRPSACWREFSNFYPSKLVVSFTFPDGREVTCDAQWAEQALMYYKAMLFNDTARANLILAAKNPARCKALGRLVGRKPAPQPFDDATWASVRDQIAEAVVFAKFDQDSRLANRLFSTGTRPIAEAAGPRDKVWGIGLSVAEARTRPRSAWALGGNLLGRTLERVRDRLRWG